jgi:hypothetical protein
MAVQEELYAAAAQAQFSVKGELAFVLKSAVQVTGFAPVMLIPLGILNATASRNIFPLAL